MHDTSVLSNQIANNLHASGVSGFKHVLNSNMASRWNYHPSRVETYYECLKSPAIEIMMPYVGDGTFK
jgi:hypothetical protein